MQYNKQILKLTFLFVLYFIIFIFLSTSTTTFISFLFNYITINCIHFCQNKSKSGMMQIIEECLKHVKIIDKLYEFLIKHTNNISDFIHLKKQCIFSLKTLKKILSSENLTVHVKQRIIHAISSVESVNMKLSKVVKIGRGFKNVKNFNDSKLDHWIQWIDIENAFKNRMRTGLIVNLQHIDLKKFLEDSSNLFEKKIKKFLMLNNNKNALKVNAILLCKFKKKLTIMKKKKLNPSILQHLMLKFIHLLH